MAPHVKKWRILLEESFAARMPLLTAAGTFGFGRRRRCQNSYQWCYLNHLHTLQPSCRKLCLHIRVQSDSITCLSSAAELITVGQQSFSVTNNVILLEVFFLVSSLKSRHISDLSKVTSGIWHCMLTSQVHPATCRLFAISATMNCGGCRQSFIGLVTTNMACHWRQGWTDCEAH